MVCNANNLISNEFKLTCLIADVKNKNLCYFTKILFTINLFCCIMGRYLEFF